MSILGSRIEGAVVWDLFCGSGAFGVECLSCGASSVVFVDSSPRNLVRIRQFIDLQNGKYQFNTVRGKLPAALERLKEPADIVFMDPPYDSACIYSWIASFSWQKKVNRGGIVVAESSSVTLLGEAWKLRNYGDTRLHMLEV